MNNPGPMNVKVAITAMLFTLCAAMEAQTMIGMTKEEVQELVGKDHREFRKDNTVVKQHFNYLKFVNGIGTRTWILYFDDEDRCKTSKLVCDYSEFDEVVEDLSASFRKTGESQWEHGQGIDTFRVELTRQEWYFTVRETRKDQGDIER